MILATLCTIHREKTTLMIHRTRRAEYIHPVKVVFHSQQPTTSKPKERHSPSHEWMAL
jgi:hypothetical protein